MSVTFPMPASDFLELLPVRSIDFELPETVEMSRTEGGEVLTETTGVRLWRGEVTLGRVQRSELRAVMTLLDVMRGGEASFMAYPKKFPYPAMDPDGSGLQGSNPTIRFLDATDARRMALEGMPADYRLTRGDMMSFRYASNPERVALHEMVDLTRPATGAGETASFEVRPAIRPGAVLGAAVSLIKPEMKAVILSGTLQRGRSNRFVTEGISFQFQQSLR
ncbi:MAG: hypothetical protein AAGL96_17985 [Pseudomonadota bacterium]